MHRRKKQMPVLQLSNALRRAVTTPNIKQLMMFNELTNFI